MALESVYPCIFLRFTVYLILTLLTPHPDKALLTGKPKETISLLIQPGSSESQSIRTKDISSLLSLIWNYYKNGVTEGYTVSWSCIDPQMFWAGGEADGQGRDKPRPSSPPRILFCSSTALSQFQYTVYTFLEHRSERYQR